MRMLFLNLPVKDLEASKRFFAELGFQFDGHAWELMYMEAN